jgi:hypothetical protein
VYGGLVLWFRLVPDEVLRSVRGVLPWRPFTEVV